MKRSSANILSLQVSEDEKLELIVTHMAPGDLKFIVAFMDLFQKRATAEQRVALIKLYDMGWNISKVVWHRTEMKMAFAIYSGDCAAWVTPDGKVNRAPVGRRTAYLDKNWVDA